MILQNIILRIYQIVSEGSVLERVTLASMMLMMGLLAVNEGQFRKRIRKMDLTPSGAERKTGRAIVGMIAVLFTLGFIILWPYR